MISGTFVKILVLFYYSSSSCINSWYWNFIKGGETSKKYSNKLMQLRVLLQFIAIVVLSIFCLFF